MPTLEERVAYLEGAFAEFGEVRESVKSLDVKVTSLDAKVTSMDAKVTSMDARLGRVETRLDTLDSKVDRNFVWTVGIQITVLLAVIGPLLTIIRR